MKRKLTAALNQHAINAPDVGEEPLPDFPDKRDRKKEVVTTRNDALLKTSAAEIQHLDAIAISTLQVILQHGRDCSHWRTPRKWKPTEKAVKLDIDLRGRIVHFLPEELRRLVREADEAKEGTREAASMGSVVTLPTVASQVHAILDGAVLTIARYLVLLRTGPVGVGVKANNTSLDPSSVCNLAYGYLPPLLAISVSKWLATISNYALAKYIPRSASHIEVGYLRLIHSEDLDGLSLDVKKNAHREAQRMRLLAERGYWNDVPSFDAPLRGITSVAGPAEKPSKETVRDSHLPLPDDYVSEMGIKSVWLIHHLAPNLLTIAQKILFLWKSTANSSMTKDSIGRLRRKLLTEFLGTYVWLDSQGQPISGPPFGLRLSQFGKNSNASRTAVIDLTQEVSDDVIDDDTEISDADRTSPVQEVEWPPRTFGEIMGLLGNVQLAHIFVVALSEGNRASEMLGLSRSCVQYARNGLPYASGLTFKLVQRHDGEMRDWVLPDLAVEALEQQVRLVTLAESIGPLNPEPRVSKASAESLTVASGANLWARIYSGSASDRRSPLIGIGKALVSYAKALGMDTRPGGQNLRHHRFRKTVARLVALALTQAPKVLMNVFGHKSIEMTLYYILTDKDLQAEIENVSRELRVMRAKEVIEKMVDDEDAQSANLPLGGYGGPAALTLRHAIERQRISLHRRGEEWGAGSAAELAEILTLQGKAWDLVRAGVICTKFPGTESGPCNASKGRPEPARCQSHCKHRLEEAFLREDVDNAIRDSLAAYQQAGNSGEELVQALWAGQIRAHISRFADLHTKWMRDPTVRSLVGESEQEGALT